MSEEPVEVILDDQTEIVLKSPIHSIVEIFPAMTADELHALKESIRATGVQTPVKMWTDPKGKTWIVDGRNRIEAVRSLKGEGLSESKDGNPLSLQIQMVDGSEFDALSDAAATNMTRRNLSPSQKAAVAVRHAFIEAKIAKKCKIKLEVVGDEKDQMKALALKVGVNRTYLYNCLTLYREAPDLLDAVANGIMKVNNAIAELNLRKSPKSTEDDEPSGEPGSEPEPSALVVYDGNRDPVPPAFNDVFLARDKFRAAASGVRSLTSDIESLCAGAGGDYLRRHIEELKAALKTVQATITGMMPQEVCSACSGTGLCDDKDCERCTTLGYTPKSMK